MANNIKEDYNSKRIDAILNILTGKEFYIHKPNESCIRAVLMSFDLPKWVKNAGVPVDFDGECWKLSRDGKTYTGILGKALWCESREGDINILSLTGNTASEYIVTVDGEDVATLSDLIPAKTLT